MPKFVGEEGRFKNEMGFSDRQIRARFIRKVFSIVFIMLSIVGLMASTPFIHHPIRVFVQANPWMYLLSYIVFVVVCISLTCCKNLRRSYPSNLFLTAILTISMGFMVTMICARHELDAVLLNLALTSIMCLGVIIFSCQTKYDFTSWLGAMFFISLFCISFGFIAIVATVLLQTTTIYIIFSGIMAVVFMIYLAIDTQTIMGGRKYEIEPEDYILASMMLFMDVINIFLSLLGMDN